MFKLTSLLLIWLMLLTGCETAPRVVVKAVCPQIPELDEVAIPPSYLLRMQEILSSSPEKPINYGLVSPPVKPSTPKLGQQ